MFWSLGASAAAPEQTVAARLGVPACFGVQGDNADVSTTTTSDTSPDVQDGAVVCAT